jgi:hypothetical protein
MCSNNVLAKGWEVNMNASSDYRRKAQRIADLRMETEELERKLDSVRTSLESELAQPVREVREAAAGRVKDVHCRARRTPGRFHHGDEPFLVSTPQRGNGAGGADAGTQDHTGEWRTETLVTHGRHSSYRRSWSLRRKAAITAAGIVVLLLAVTILVVVLSGGGPSWPASVATVQAESARACQNPDTRSEPDQVNFACAPATRQVLWVFALMTSDDNSGFADPQTGREGLEPITPAEGGQVAWSLNLHQPYNPLNPVDSLEVAARAINSIIGGATVTAANGSPVVQPGLEATPANCLRYTGSAAVTSRQGFPGLCAGPVVSAAGQAALVADVYQKWIVGATAQAAQDAAVLFENASNPGDAEVQAILRHLPQLAA